MNVGKYYVAGIPFDSENSLSHHGVKGMEWNKHKFGLDADTRFIKWINPNDINVGSFGKYGKMAEAAAKQKYGAAAPTPKGRLTTVYNKQSVMDSRDRAVQNMNRQKWNNSPIGKASNFVTGTANRAGKAIGTAAGNASQWVNQQAQNAGRAIGNAANQASKWAGQQAKNIDQSLNITGNKDRADAEKFRGYADKANSQFNKDYWNNRANESQNRADSSLAGRATAAGNWVGTQARNVGNAVGGAANAAGQWVGTQAQNVANSAPVQAVGNFIDQNITGNTDRAAAQDYQGIAEDLADDHHRQKWEDAAKRAQERADSTLFGRVGNAANAVGDWAGQAAQNVGNTVSQAAEQARGGIGGFFDRVGNAVGGAANAVGGWAGQAARDVGGAISGAANGVGEFVDNKLNLSGNQAQAEANRYRNLSSNTDGQTNKNYWDSKAAEAQQKADNSLAGRAKGFLNSAGQWVSGAAGNVGQAAKNVGGAISGAANKATEGAKGFLNSAGQWVSGAAGNVGQAAKNVGGAISGAASSVGDWARDVPGNVGTWAGQAAQNVGGAISGAANSVGDFARDLPGNVSNFVDQNITGNSARAEANRYNTFAQNPNMDSVQQLMNQRAAENAQARADNSLFGRVGNAAGAVGDFARNLPGNIAGAAQNVGGSISGAANNVGEFFTGRNANANLERLYTENIANGGNGMSPELAAARAQYNRTLPGMAEWAVDNIREGVIPDIEEAISGAANSVGQQAQKVSNWYTGQPNADRAEAIDRQVQEYERMGDMMYDRGMNNEGARYHQLAANLGRAADANQAMYDNAPRQQLSGIAGNVADWWNRRNPFVQHSAIDEKPDGVSDSFWEKFTADGGTREDYERDWR